MLHLAGNAHLDPAWMWRMDEGLAAFAATCRSALDRIEEFPDFIFTCSSAAHYAFVEETDPALFARIQQAVKDDRWCIVGGWWVEPDCNLPSGESFVRQALLGQRYFANRFGRIATVGYCVDSFGHNANLPQLLRKSGMDSYVFMRPQQEEKELSAPLLAWEAPSGERIKAYRLPLHYSNHQYFISDKVNLLPKQAGYSPDKPWMIFYGVGNHGGGPTIEQLRQIESLRTVRDDVTYSDPVRFFAGVDLDSLPVVRDEMQRHAIGCFSAHSEIKQLNRRAENVLTEAESISVLASLAGVEPATSNFGQAWKNVCFNQFHDILGGVAIKEACDDAITMYREATSIAERSIQTNVQRIASRVDTSAHIENLIVFNPSAFEREELIEFELWHPEASERGEMLHSVALIDADGKSIPCQKTESSGKIGEDRARFTANVRIPSFGWNVFGIERNVSQACPSQLEVASDYIANVTMRLMLSEKEEAGSTSQMQLRYAPAIVLEDRSDTWSHDKTSYNDILLSCMVDSMEVIERGPIRAGIRVKSGGYSSRMEEEYYLGPESDSVEVRVFLDWREQHRILKLRLPHFCTSPVARYEIPYASIERPVGSGEWPGQTWVDVTERDGSRGLAVISDSKYSVSVDDEYIYIIAARSPLFAHHVPPHVPRLNERLRYQDQGEQEFRLFLVPHKGDWRKANLPRLSEQLHKPLIVHHESRHEGDLLGTYSGFEYSAEGIRIGAIKHAEEGDGIIVRAVEEHGLEDVGTFRIPTLAAEWTAAFGPYEIKTFLIAAGRVIETDLIERPL